MQGLLIDNSHRDSLYQCHLLTASSVKKFMFRESWILCLVFLDESKVLVENTTM